MLKHLFSYTTYLLVSFLIVISIFLYKKDSQLTYSAPNIGLSYDCFVNRVIDGDSVVANCDALSKQNLSIRLLHIDTPELSQYPWGDNSRLFLNDLLRKNDRKITVVFNGRDIYNRYLAEIFIGNKSINLILAEKGLARVYENYNPPVQYVQAMAKAKQQKLGIWQERGLQQDPQRYRRLSR